MIPGMRVRMKSYEFYRSECVTRIPFRFGISTLTRAPQLTARLELDTEAGPATGYSADLLVPKWFEKDPDKSVEQDLQALLMSARAAFQAAAHPVEESPFALWWRVYRQRVESRPERAADRLVRGFGVALFERALLDAACRAAGKSFFEALQTDLFAVRPGAVLSELEGFDLAASLPEAPLQRIELRHTIGLLDPLRAAQIEPEQRVDDGLPQALDEDIRRYGLTLFKLKLAGDVERDFERWLEFKSVLDEQVNGKARFTVDGNEQFAELGPLIELLRRLDAERGGRSLLDGLLYIEQPLPRAESLDERHRTPLSALSEIAPVILDEADSGTGSFKAALALGYGGISVKNCKGVLRALLNHCLCVARGVGFQSAEDLTNLGVLALQQDLATVAALGLTHAERNGHHYFRGLDHLPQAEARDALAAHPDLYEPLGDSVALRIEQGALSIGSLQRPGYGYDLPIRIDQRTKVAT